MSIDDDESPSVIGNPGHSPMPSEEDRKSAWKRLYVARFVAAGLDAETAEGWFSELVWDDVKDEDPEAEADAEMEYWDAE